MEESILLLEKEAQQLLEENELWASVDKYNQCYQIIAGSSSFMKPGLDEVRTRVLLGRSSALYKLKKYADVVSDCKKILCMPGEFNNSRAQNRLISACCSLGQFSSAESFALDWKIKFPSNVDAIRAYERVRSILRALEDDSGIGNGIADMGILEKPGSSSDIRKSPDGMEEAPHGNGSSNNILPSFHCSYCSITLSTEQELQIHCRSESHQLMLMSDDGKNWTYRHPPRGVNADAYSLCEQVAEGRVCRLGDQCVSAHSKNELEEWKERYAYRLTRLEQAQENNLYGKSYTDLLLERWLKSSNPEKILCQNLDGINVVCEDELVVSVNTKKSAHQWTFYISSSTPLRQVALLHDSHRNHFHLVAVGQDRSKTEDHPQEWSGKSAFPIGIEACNRLPVVVYFAADIFGTFRQTITFDFGKDPIVIRQLCVDVVPVAKMGKLTQIKEAMLSQNRERWDSSNANIVEFEPRPVPLTPDEKKLLEKYPVPQAATFVLTQTVLDKVLNESNYADRTHELLYIEEMAQREQVAQYNLTATITLANSYILTTPGHGHSTAKYSQDGQLYALMRLSSQLSGDSTSGRLLLNQCTSVYITSSTELKNAQKEQRTVNVYEAIIEDKAKATVYLRVPSRMVTELRLRPNDDITVEVQFQLGRLTLCHLHQAIDRSPPISTLFPAVGTITVPWSPCRQWGESIDSRLNPKQREAVLAITSSSSIALPPILLIGPFGTGKTFTLAHAIKLILMQDNTRVLVCTHSNSAADLYIKEYLHACVKSGNEKARPLRIYYIKRWVSTVHPTVQQYCLIETEGREGNVVRSFRAPTYEDVEKHRVIVGTLSTSRDLIRLNVDKGFFTHILLDEAAQSMECEALTPLALAGEKTRIVLAGDHMQLCPEVCSPFVRERKLHLSLLERLYDHYPDSHPCKILLCENYRSHHTIVDYTSSLFYDHKLISSGKQLIHPSYYPLTFFTARGEEMQESNSTSFFNTSEVYEVVERVAELRGKWPKDWGNPDSENAIGVLTPYADQVQRIRVELRRRRMFSVSVERVLNVQGKEFRVVILSTVRTRLTCVPMSNMQMEEELDYGFLSNARLLNTAVTRAQSLVAVVGDPVALCSVGKCRKLWEKFVTICQNHMSLYGISWSSLRAQLDAVELRGHLVLNPLAPEFIPGLRYHTQGPPLTFAPQLQVGQHLPMYPGFFSMNSMPYVPHQPYYQTAPVFPYPSYQQMMPMQPGYYMGNAYSGNQLSYQPWANTWRPQSLPWANMLPNMQQPGIPPLMATSIRPPGQNAPIRPPPPRHPAPVPHSNQNQVSPPRPMSNNTDMRMPPPGFKFLNNVHFPNVNNNSSFPPLPTVPVPPSTESNVPGYTSAETVGRSPPNPNPWLSPTRQSNRSKSRQQVQQNQQQHHPQHHPQHNQQQHHSQQNQQQYTPLENHFTKQNQHESHRKDKHKQHRMKEDAATRPTSLLNMSPNQNSSGRSETPNSDPENAKEHRPSTDDLDEEDESMLLPSDSTKSELINSPYRQLQWFNHLLTSKGPRYANKFLQVMTKKESMPDMSLPTAPETILPTPDVVKKIEDLIADDSINHKVTPPWMKTPMLTMHEVESSMLKDYKEPPPVTKTVLQPPPSVRQNVNFFPQYTAPSTSSVQRNQLSAKADEIFFKMPPTTRHKPLSYAKVLRESGAPRQSSPPTNNQQQPSSVQSTDGPQFTVLNHTKPQNQRSQYRYFP